MTAFIRGMKDTLDQRAGEFAQAPLRETLFLNSIPKGGTHLIRNIMRMFVPPEQHYHHEFIQIPNLQIHARAFGHTPPYLSCGHLLFSDMSVRALGAARHIVLVRDPYDWVLARARFHISDEFQQANLAHLKTGEVPVEELLNMMILGIHQKAPSLLDIYMHNAAAWVGTRAVILRYEDLAEAVGDLSSRRSETRILKLLADCGIDPVPADWRARVEAGADRRQSRTARENLKLAPGVVLPDQLPEAQRRLVEFSAPGLRALFGYT
jgi:hypothetical protein